MRRGDNPIVYVSDTFTKLTGYSEQELMGKNCRFLQSPDGQVEKGSFRKYCDNGVIHAIKDSVDRREECQYTAINYKKTGEPFINLMTLIPISEYDRPGEIAFYVGLQKRLTHSVQVDNYADFNEEVHDLIAPAHSPAPREITPELPGVMHNFIESFGDFVHILSLRGLFLYAAPNSSQKLLEYSAEELMGHPLSEFVHPADLVSVMRELRSAAPEDAINIICRFRRKVSGYMYMEINGHMYEGEAGKRTKCFVLTGREKFVPSLPIKDVLVPKRESAETWAKFSPQGLILFICNNSSELFGQSQDEMYAKSILEYVHESDQQSMKDALRRVAGERIVQNVRCQIVNKRSHVPVLFRLYSDGDPLGRTIVAQIRLLEATDGDEPHMLGAEYGDLFDGGNLFDVMGEVRVTSLHYELNQLRIHNKRLRSEVESLTAVPKKKSVSAFFLFVFVDLRGGWGTHMS
ncbi:blue light receptor [Rhizophlyctis rosea]|nr:blue light receptor [Rhizophlyctis rosea]